MSVQQDRYALRYLRDLDGSKEANCQTLIAIGSMDQVAELTQVSSVGTGLGRDDLRHDPRPTRSEFSGISVSFEGVACSETGILCGCVPAGCA